MTEKSEIVTLQVDRKTLERIEKAKKEGETISDVFTRLSETKLLRFSREVSER